MAVRLSDGSLSGSSPHTMSELLENGIYSLPDGREFVARSGYSGSYFLHDLRLGAGHPPIYLVDGSGQLLSWGYRTCWRIEDLLMLERGHSPARVKLRLVK